MLKGRVMKSCVLVGVLGLCASFASAELLHDWDFNSAADGTSITDGSVVNSVGTTGWSPNAWESRVYSSQDSVLVGGRLGADNTGANIDNIDISLVSYLRIDGVRWQLTGGSAGERIRIGIADNNATNRLAGIELFRQTGTNVTLTGYSDSGDDISPTVALTSSSGASTGGTYAAISDETWDFVIELDDPIDEEHFAIDRIRVSTTTLVPEPGSMALLSIGVLALLPRRRTSTS